MNFWSDVGKTVGGWWDAITSSGGGPTPAAPDAAGPAAGAGGLAEEPVLAKGGIGRAVELAAAKAMLADRFEVGDAPDGEAAPNQVTAAEYEEICKLYADINGGRSNFTFDDGGLGEYTPPDDFRGQVMGDIATMLQAKGGRELLKTLAYGKSAGEKDELDREIKLLYHKQANKAHESHKRWDGEQYVDTPYLAVQYAPGTPYDNCHTEFDADTVLFHELVHAYHDRNGTLPADGATVGKPVHPYDAGLDAAEYQAVGLGDGAEHGVHPMFNENAYRAERRALGEKDAPRDRYRGVAPGTEGGACEDDHDHHHH
jgi:hypothetical protein